MIDVITSSSNYYNDARQEWNRSIDKYPTAIAYCKTFDDVKKAVLFAKKNKFKLRIRSGRHNYEGFSIDDGIFVIDISNLNRIEINYENNTVTAEGGTLFGQLYNFIGSNGYPFPGASSSTVGVAGLTLGGGWSYSSRYLGLACDYLSEIKLINYEGSIITADKNTNSDLFWALKGAGGGNFGVIVSLTFDLPPKVDLVTTFNIYYSNISKENQIKFLDIWQHWITTTTDKINMKASIANSSYDGSYIYCTGLLYGTPNELMDILSPFMNIEGFNLTYENVSFLQATEIISSFYNQYERFISYSRFVSREYSHDELSKLIDIINEPRPEGSQSTLLKLYGLGGKVSEINKADTAFYYRNSNYIISIESNFEDNEYKKENTKWIEVKSKYIYNITDGSYINFPYYPLNNYLYEYYGDNYKYLQKVNRKYDPLNTFDFQHGIR
ncbi:Uncharacterized FAD-linked oxidoreductase yvdP [uncultured Clostridium sp.]|uniref:FAD-dependent oxidoreductase n=1 Tax=uncultured Clostridium sp. TaxID=59620 RepID=UPI0008217C5A|nr:FAD-binding oxidoreductase [uncultured Clostridium sp.]SCK02080.1 Uncharacterized FAD-linked oxidoreductase yvdP [uncultured Clostridium sp.]